MKKLWQKNKTKLNSFVESFESKGDLLFDQKLLEFDVQGSLAHVQMLENIGILSKTEANLLAEGLNKILSLHVGGEFNLTVEDEDVHTKIENYLTKKYGHIGQKVHTARSRNDQVLTALRLYCKQNLLITKELVMELKQILRDFTETYGNQPMPGYSHMQKAMPTTIRVWISSFYDSLSDDVIQLKSVEKIIDQSPLGSGAGFGVPLNIDRKFTAKQLGFAKVQENVMYCQNSRIKFEAAILALLLQLQLTLNKLASDLLLFTTSEFGYFEISDTVSTGSSIMPQKKNLDLAELIRSKLHVVLGNYVQIVSLGSNLVSGYNRDHQDTKKPLMESLEITQDCLKAAKVLLENIKPNKKALENAMTHDLYATEEALKLVKQGIPFRAAYQNVARKM
jgi:argininosuccinate lyase